MGKTPPLPTIKWGATSSYVTSRKKKKISPKRSSDAWGPHHDQKISESKSRTSSLKKHPKSGDLWARPVGPRQSWVSSITIQDVTETKSRRFFWGWWLSIEAVVVPAKGEILNCLPSDSGICEVKFSPIQTPSVSISSKPECLTKRCVLPKQQMTQSGTQAKLICEFKRTSLKPFSSRNCWDV